MCTYYCKVEEQNTTGIQAELLKDDTNVLICNYLSFYAVRRTSVIAPFYPSECKQLSVKYTCTADNML